MWRPPRPDHKSRNSGRMRGVNWSSPPPALTRPNPRQASCAYLSMNSMLERGGRNPEQTGIGLAEFEDQKDREGDRQTPERQRGIDQPIGLGVEADAEKQRRRPEDQNCDEEPGHRPARHLEGDQQSRLLDHAGVQVRRRQRRFLDVGLRFQRRKIVGDRLRVGERRANRQGGRVGAPSAPERFVAFDDSLLDLVPQGLGFRSVLPERLIEPQDLGGEGLQIGLLGRIVSETDADQRSQNQRKKKADQARYLTNDALDSPVLCASVSRVWRNSPAYPAAMNTMKMTMQMKRIFIGYAPPSGAESRQGP